MALRRSISVMPSAVRRSSSTERTSEPSCSRWQRRCACSLSSSSRSIRSLARWKRLTVDHSKILEVGFEAGVAQGRHEGVEDVGDGASDVARFGQRPRIGLVLKGTIAVELQFGEDVVGRGWRTDGSWPVSSWSVVMGCFLLSDRPRPSRPSWRQKAAGGPDLHRGATAAGAKRRMAEAGYFASRCKARRRSMNKNVKTHATGARRKIAGRSHCRAGPLAARSPSQEGRRRGPLRRKRPDIADPAAPQPAPRSPVPATPHRRHEARDVLRDELHPHCRPQRIDAEATQISVEVVALGRQARPRRSRPRGLGRRDQPLRRRQPDRCRERHRAGAALPETGWRRDARPRVPPSSACRADAAKRQHGLDALAGGQQRRCAMPKRTALPEEIAHRTPW